MGKATVNESKPKKPFFKRPLVWVVAVIICIAVIGAGNSGKKGAPNNAGTSDAGIELLNTEKESVSNPEDAMESAIKSQAEKKLVDTSFDEIQIKGTFEPGKDSSCDLWVYLNYNKNKDDEVMRLRLEDNSDKMADFIAKNYKEINELTLSWDCPKISARAGGKRSYKLNNGKYEVLETSWIR